MHSQEPWREEGDHIVDVNGRDIIGFGESDSDDTERMVACVNFCVGIPNEVLLRRGKHLEHRVEYIPCWGISELKVTFSEINQVVITIDKKQ